MRPTVIASSRLERRGRWRVLEAAPNFTAKSACVRGDQGVMRAVWAEHGRGGRAKQGWPLQQLVPLKHAQIRGRYDGLAVKLTEDQKGTMYRRAAGRLPGNMIPPRYTRMAYQGRGV